MRLRKAMTPGSRTGKLAVLCLLVALLGLVSSGAACRWTTPNQGAEEIAGQSPDSTEQESVPVAGEGQATEAGSQASSEPAPAEPAPVAPAPALTPSSPTETPPPPAPTASGLVCLDPGHADTPYEIDPETGLNTMDWANEPEIEIVWDIAVRAAAILRARGVDVVLTKSSAYDPVSLKQRAVIANSAGAALVVHIHTDPGISNPTTFYPGAAPYNWKANSDSGRTAYISSAVQQASAGLAGVFHSAMAAYLAGSLGAGDGGLAMENRGSTGTGNYGPVLSYDVWSWIPTFTLENNESFADSHRQAVAQSVAAGVIACLNGR